MNEYLSINQLKHSYQIQCTIFCKYLVVLAYTSFLLFCLLFSCFINKLIKKHQKSLVDEDHQFTPIPIRNKPVQ